MLFKRGFYSQHIDYSHLMKLFLFSAFGVSTIFFIPSAIADSPINPADQEMIQQQQKFLLKEAKEQRESLQRSVNLEKAPIVDLEEDIEDCFEIETITFQGATQLSASAQRNLTKSYLNQCLTLNKIHRLINEVSNFYIGKGFITTQAFLTQQDVSDKALMISVQEGKIEKILLEDKTPFVLSVAFPGLTGQVLNLRDIEQGLEQLNRLTSQRVSIDIVPSAQPGYSVIELTYDPRRYPTTLSVSFDNSGQKSTGVAQMSVNMTSDNLFGMAEQWHFSAGRNADFRNNHQSRQFSGQISQPYGFWTFGYQYAWNDYFYDIPLYFNTWRYQGKSQSHRASVNRVLYRDGKSKLTFTASLNRRKTQTYLEDEKLGISSPTLTSATVGLNFSTSLNGGYWTFNPTFHQGLSLFGATEDDDAFPDAPKSRFRKLSVSGSFYKPLSESTYYFGSIYGQWTHQNLYSAERISVGGEYSVRGFKEQSLTGNRGLYWRNEVNWQIKTLPYLGDLSLSGALDSGWVQSQQDQIEGGNLIGSALTLSLAGKWINQSFSFGVPLRHPNSFEPDKWVSYYQISALF